VDSESKNEVMILYIWKRNKMFHYNYSRVHGRMLQFSLK